MGTKATNMKKNIDKRRNNGGKRPHSGRKKKPYKTTTIAFRVKVEHVDKIKESVKILINNLNKNKMEFRYLRFIEQANKWYLVYQTNLLSILDIEISSEDAQKLIKDCFLYENEKNKFYSTI